MDDKKIVCLFNERSEQAISELADKYGKLCFKIAFNILGNVNDAEECVNDAYLGVWKNIPPQNPAHLQAYLCRITRNISLNRYNKNIALKRNSYYEVSISELEDCIPDPNSESQVSEHELAEVIREFSGSLNRADRTIFIKRYWMYDPIADIAKEFGITEHNATVRLSRIRNKLRVFLVKKGVSI